MPIAFARGVVFRARGRFTIALGPSPGSWGDSPSPATDGRFQGNREVLDRGALFGLAVGDIMETALESQPPGMSWPITFRDGCLMAVNLGDDADTTGALYGQLAGAHFGGSGIPREWLAKLARRDPVKDLARRPHEGAP